METEELKEFIAEFWKGLEETKKITAQNAKIVT